METVESVFVSEISSVSVSFLNLDPFRDFRNKMTKCVC